MLYCDRCADRTQWPKSLPRSWRACELCYQAAQCNDFPISQLPDLSLSTLLEIVREANHPEERAQGGG